MTDNQNKNKTTMKDIQLQDFLFKTASRMPEMFPKTLFFFVFVCSSSFLTRGYARAYHELLQGLRYANESLTHS